MNQFIRGRVASLFLAIWTTCGLTLALATSSCSTFNHEWEKASAAPPPACEMTGRWEGSWVSEVNGHRGRLRCLVSRLDDRSYRARFNATYWKCFRFGYAVNLTVTREPTGAFKFQGEADLGWWGGGVYHYDGHANPGDFVSTYRSEYDHGTFQMARPDTIVP